LKVAEVDLSDLTFLRFERQELIDHLPDRDVGRLPRPVLQEILDRLWQCSPAAKLSVILRYQGGALCDRQAQR
jgi:hypothetical protein